MKQKILYAIVVLAIAILAVINVSVSLNSQSDDVVFHLTQANHTEAIAGEWAGWGNFLEGQGLYKDEQELKEPCPSEQSTSGSGSASYGGGSVSGSGSDSQTNPSNRNDIRCGYGSENCTRVKC